VRLSPFRDIGKVIQDRQNEQGWGALDEKDPSNKDHQESEI